MILYKGIIYNNYKQNELIDTLREDIYNTLNKKEELNYLDVINACDILIQKVKNKEYDNIILPLLNNFEVSLEKFNNYLYMFEKEALLKKVEIELNFKKSDNIKTKIAPLGILFHIAAGNIDVLPAYSVIEGLLAGNINILKLPAGDSGVSVKLLSELIIIEPKLKDYIYVFDVPSTEVETLKVFADISDAVVVWGGDLAVSAARKFVSVNTKIIEWGHKLSFAYSSINYNEKDLYDLADHICATNQLLCSSCQGIFVDTESMDELKKFSETFFNILKKVSLNHNEVSKSLRGKNTLNLYTLELENTKDIIYKDKGISLRVCEDSTLELSSLYRNIWVKRLPKKDIINNIKKHKSHLQTVGVTSNNENELNEYINILMKSGVTRIRKPKDMSEILLGESHDGLYPLKEYSKIIEYI